MTSTDMDFLASWMPLRFNALVVETTNQCNAKCAMCYQSSGPNGSDLHGKARLSTHSIQRIIDEASEIDTIGKRFHFSGGEAFLEIDKCLDLVSHAKKKHFTSITAVTNAFWSTNLDNARSICKKLREAGLTSLEISWDVWHLPYIKPIAVSNCIEACYEFDIVTNLRVLASKSATHQEALLHLSPEAIQKANLIYCSQVFPTGRAQDLIGADSCYDVGNLNGACHSTLNLTINAYGEVFPCCAGFDQTDTYRFGNINEYSLADIVKCMNNSLLLRNLVFYGTTSLKRILESHDYDIGKNFTSICHLCSTIFTDMAATTILKNHFASLQRERLLSILDQASEVNI